MIRLGTRVGTSQFNQTDPLICALAWCTCLPAWDGAPGCAACATGRYGVDCSWSCAACEAHGTCLEGVAGNCTCDLGWAGVSCSVCAAGWAGGNCTACDVGYFRVDGLCVPCSQCEFGTCVVGEACACYEAAAGPTCSECARGYYGATCFDCDACALHGYCVEGRSGECVCDPGWTEPKCQDQPTAAPTGAPAETGTP